MAKKKSTSTALAKVNQPIKDVVRPLSGSGELVRVEAVYHVRDVHPISDGPWAGEADKIAWTDPMSGYGCIIRRSPRDQHLCGYVAVPPGHPLFGRADRSLLGLDIGVHGGVNYAAECRGHEPEDRSICHVTVAAGPPGFQQLIYANDAANDQDDAWWFGFSCNHAGDVVPAARSSAVETRTLDGINEPTYKTEGFVYRECVRLAAQLKAVADGLDPAGVDPGPAANAYDPAKARSR